MDLCSPPCPSDPRGLACTPLVGPRATGAAGGTSQRWDLGACLLPSFGAVEMRCCMLAHPALRPALRLLAWQGTDLVLAVFSAVPWAACLHSPSGWVHSTPVLFLTEVLQGIMFEPGDLNTRCSLKHLQKLCPLSGSVCSLPLIFWPLVFKPLAIFLWRHNSDKQCSLSPFSFWRGLS